MKKTIQFKIYFVTSPVAIKSVIVHIFRSYIHEYMPVIWLDRENGTNNYWAIFHNEEETYTKNFK